MPAGSCYPGSKTPGLVCMEDERTETISRIATFCAGSFWDLESVFRHLNGVVATSVGFMGGTVTAPTYGEVCTGKTGHSEVVMIAYDPGHISYGKLLDIYFNSSDPCSRQQGEYAGTQYGPVIFCHDDQDKQLGGGVYPRITSKRTMPGGGSHPDRSRINILSG